MRKLFYILCFLGMAACGFVLSNPQLLVRLGDLSQTGSKNPIGTILESENTVYRRLNDFLVWLPVGRKADVFLNDYIYTGKNSSVTIGIRDTKVKIEANSLVVLRKKGSIPYFELEYGEGTVEKEDKKIPIKPKTQVLLRPSSKKSKKTDKWIAEPQHQAKIWFKPKDRMSIFLKKALPSDSKLLLFSKSSNRKVYEKNMGAKTSLNLSFYSEGQYEIKIAHKESILEKSSFDLLHEKSPELLFPEDNTVLDVDGKFVFGWSEVPLTREYELQLASDENFKSILMAGRSTTPYFKKNMDLEEGSYFWRVRVTKGEVPSKKWSPAHKFSVGDKNVEPILEDELELAENDEEVKNAEPAIPDLAKIEKLKKVEVKKAEEPPPITINPTHFLEKQYVVKEVSRSPADLGSKKVGVFLNWQKAEDVKSYKIDFYSNENEENPIQSQIVSGASYQGKISWRPGDKIQAKISAKHPVTGKWISDQRSLASIVVKDELSLPRPILDLPKNKSKVFAMGTVGNKKVLLSWRKVRHAESYELQVGYDVDFARKAFKGKIKKYSKMIELTELKGKVFWKVRAVHSKGQSEWSDTFSFDLK